MYPTLREGYAYICGKKTRVCTSPKNASYLENNRMLLHYFRSNINRSAKAQQLTYSDKLLPLI